MTRTMRVLLLILVIPLLSLVNVGPAFAIPPFPSSFYGIVKLNGAKVPDGTLVQALIGGNMYAQTYTSTYEGNSVFALDVPGDDSSSTEQEGGRDGDTIQFKVGGVVANETGTWKVATNTNLNLTVTESAPLNTPQPTPTRVPTQTAIIKPKPTRTPTAQVHSQPMNEAPINPSPIPTLHAEPTSKSAAVVKPMENSDPSVHPSPVAVAPVEEEQPAAAAPTLDNEKTVNRLGISVLILIILGFGFWIVRSRSGINQKRS